MPGPFDQHSRDDGLLDGLANLGLSNLLHLGKNHGRDLLGRESLLLVEVVNLNVRRAVLVNDGEGPVLIESLLDAWPATYQSCSHLHVLLNVSVVVSSADQSLGVEDGVEGVHGRLVLGGWGSDWIRRGAI